MAATLAEHSAVPFHLGLTEPSNETTSDDYPAVEGAYDPVEQIWKLPTGTPLTDPKARSNAQTFTFSDTYCVIFDPSFRLLDDVIDDGI